MAPRGGGIFPLFMGGKFFSKGLGDPKRGGHKEICNSRGKRKGARPTFFGELDPF